MPSPTFLQWLQVLLRMSTSNDEYKPQNWPESQGHADDEDLYNDDPTPKKKQKKIKVPVRETINASRKEHASEPLARKAENRASHLKYEYMDDTNN
jgi:hypothetical protein